MNKTFAVEYTATSGVISEDFFENVSAPSWQEALYDIRKSFGKRFTIEFHSIKEVR